jgi:hypothetical protein
VTWSVPRSERKAAKKGGPASWPTLPGSLVPRAKIRVRALQGSVVRPFSVVESCLMMTGVGEESTRRGRRRERRLLEVFMIVDII